MDNPILFKKPQNHQQMLNSFGHAASAHEHSEEKKATPAAAVPETPHCAVQTAEDGSQSSLQKYIQNLDNPGAIPMATAYSHEADKAAGNRIEHFAELISQEIHSKVDARVLTSAKRDEMERIISECVAAVVQQNLYKMTPQETASVTSILKSDIFGLGPLDELLADDEISDIMVDGPNEVFIEVRGLISRTGIRFRSEDHLRNICQRIVTRVGRHVDLANPICDARLPDGSRVNVILPPLSLKGTALTIRKFKKERLTLDKLTAFGTVDDRVARLLEIISACRINTIITGGTGSGKTTLLNCLTKYIDPRERIITCEDTAELQIQQPQALSLETRPASAEDVGLVTMRDLVRNCLRMRPDRIIVGEVRGPEAFELLQAMNTGHDGCMGTFHANSPRDALFRLENMVAMANLSLPISAIRQQIASSLEVIIHTQRLRDGSRKVVNVAQIVGMEGDTITMDDLVTYSITGEDENHRLRGEFVFSSIRPQFYQKTLRFDMERELLEIMRG